MTHEPTIGLPLLLLAGATAAIVVAQVRDLGRQVRGLQGKPYGRLLDEVNTEQLRRTDLLKRLVLMRDARLTRLERRTERAR